MSTVKTKKSVQRKSSVTIKKSKAGKPKLTVKKRTKTVVRKQAAPKKAAPKKAKAKKVAKKKLSMKEIFAFVHQKLVQNQQNIRHLEHVGGNSNQRFRANQGGVQLPTHRTMHHSRGK